MPGIQFSIPGTLKSIRTSKRGKDGRLSPKSRRLASAFFAALRSKDQTKINKSIAEWWNHKK